MLLTVADIRRRLAAGGLVMARPLWDADDGSIKFGRSGDVVQMLDDLGIDRERRIQR